MIKKKILISFFILNIFLIGKSFSVENKILFKINNEIITSIDILNEAKYLEATNKNFQKVKSEDIYKISLNSLIREKIKKIELQNNMNELIIDEDYLNQLIISMYKKLNFENKENFLDHLNTFNISLKTIENKVKIEALWNELIYFKFFEKINIDKNKIRKNIEKQKQKKIKSFFLSEIIFNKKENFSVEQTFDQISKDITDKGFKGAALIHSISRSASSGGELGWINEDSINKKFKKELINLNRNEHTKPITIPGGFLILKLIDVKEVENEVDIEKKLDEIIKNETNQQLNQFSNIYYNKVKKNIKINEL
tara:strand:- start:2448 stop:3380 length:933 start_codon:yes stop_codon:yes gene_type:complete